MECRVTGGIFITYIERNDAIKMIENYFRHYEDLMDSIKIVIESRQQY